MFKKIVKIRNNFNPEMYYIKMTLKSNQKTAETMCLCITSANIIVGSIIKVGVRDRAYKKISKK